MTIEHRGREVAFDKTVGLTVALINAARKRPGEFSLVDPRSDTVCVFRFGARGTNGGSEHVYQQLARFVANIPKDLAVVRGMPQGYAVRGNEINEDPVCQKKGIVWKRS